MGWKRLPVVRCPVRHTSRWTPARHSPGSRRRRWRVPPHSRNGGRSRPDRVRYRRLDTPREMRVSRRAAPCEVRSLCRRPSDGTNRCRPAWKQV